jgi:hypothetical protein
MISKGSRRSEFWNASAVPGNCRGSPRHPYLTLVTADCVHANMLLARREPNDRDEAAGLLNAAPVTARELGMRALEERITAEMTRMKADLH